MTTLPPLAVEFRGRVVGQRRLWVGLRLVRLGMWLMRGWALEISADGRRLDVVRPRFRVDVEL